MKLRMPSPALAVAVLALIVAMSGSAVAASLITSSQIKNGTIQLKDLSKKTIATLRGHQGARGLQGVQGGPGLQGAQGVAGPVGPSEVFTFTHSGSVELPHTYTAQLPAGKYLIFGRAQVNNNSTTTERPQCRLKAETDEDQALLGTSQNETNDDTADATLMVTHTFGAAGTVTLTCESGVETSLEDVSITAIRVGSTTSTAF
jgi:hypothetical protein